MCLVVNLMSSIRHKRNVTLRTFRFSVKENRNRAWWFAPVKTQTFMQNLQVRKGVAWHRTAEYCCFQIFAYPDMNNQGSSKVLGLPKGSARVDTWRSIWRSIWTWHAMYLPSHPNASTLIHISPLHDAGWNRKATAVMGGSILCFTAVQRFLFASKIFDKKQKRKSH